MIPASQETLHASCVALGSQGALILGPSGSGKSALALQLMALGCTLVSDDRTEVTAKEGMLWAHAPSPIRGLIEARGMGLLAAETLPHARLALVIDLGTAETERLPPHRLWHRDGLALPCLHRIEGAHFPAAVLQYLKSGRIG